jgi:protein disulfide-isomerase
MNIATHRLVFATMIVALVFVNLINSTSRADEIRWQRDVNQVVDSAQVSGKPILVFVTAQWCHYCQKMKHETLRNPQLAAAVSSSFEALIVDGDRNTQLVSQMGVKGFPTTLLYSTNGMLLAQKAGFMSPAEMDGWLRSTTR